MFLLNEFAKLLDHRLFTIFPVIIISLSIFLGRCLWFILSKKTVKHYMRLFSTSDKLLKSLPLIDKQERYQQNNQTDDY